MFSIQYIYITRHLSKDDRWLRLLGLAGSVNFCQMENNAMSTYDVPQGKIRLAQKLEPAALQMLYGHWKSHCRQWRWNSRKPLWSSVKNAGHVLDLSEYLCQQLEELLLQFTQHKMTVPLHIVLNTTFDLFIYSLFLAFVWSHLLNFLGNIEKNDFTSVYDRSMWFHPVFISTQSKCRQFLTKYTKKHCLFNVVGPSFL